MCWETFEKPWCVSAISHPDWPNWATGTLFDRRQQASRGVCAAERSAQGSSGLSANDGLCLLLARHRSSSVLLTGDRLLRRAAEDAGVRVHGALWVVDQLQAAGVCSASRLIAALAAWREDLTVFLPRAEIDQRLRRLRAE